MHGNLIITEAGRIVSESLAKRIDSKISKKGIYPLPMLVLTARGIDVANLKGAEVKCYEAFFRACSHPEVQSAIFGLDRRVTPEQQLPTDSVLTCILYEKTSSAIALVQARDCFRFGIIPYQYRPRMVKPLQWDHEFWTRQMRQEMQEYVPNVIVGKTGTIHLHSLGRVN